MFNRDERLEPQEDNGVSEDVVDDQEPEVARFVDEGGPDESSSDSVTVKYVGQAGFYTDTQSGIKFRRNAPTEVDADEAERLTSLKRGSKQLFVYAD